MDMLFSKCVVFYVPLWILAAVLVVSGGTRREPWGRGGSTKIHAKYTCQSSKVMIRSHLDSIDIFMSLCIYALLAMQQFVLVFAPSFDIWLDITHFGEGKYIMITL